MPIQTWRSYAFKQGIIAKNYWKEYSRAKTQRIPRETVNRYCNERGWEEQEQTQKEEVKHGQADQESEEASRESRTCSREVGENGQEARQESGQAREDEKEGEMLVKDKLKKKVLSHIKEDTKEFKKQLLDDKKLKKVIKKEKKNV